MHECEPADLCNDDRPDPEAPPSKCWNSRSETHMEISLTVKLRGRTTTLDECRARTRSPGTRCIKPLTHHGPFQRLLDSMPRNSPDSLVGQIFHGNDDAVSRTNSRSRVWGRPKGAEPSMAGARNRPSVGGHRVRRFTAGQPRDAAVGIGHHPGAGSDRGGNEELRPIPLILGMEATRGTQTSRVMIQSIAASRFAARRG